jgi:hypothetical protein
MRRFRTPGVILAGALAVGVAGVAVAHTTTTPSSVTGDRRPGPTQLSVTFFGEVNSRSDRCVRRREVELWDVRTFATKIGETEADADGDWRITTLQGRLRGTQFVQIRKKTVVRRGRHTHKCGFDKQRID